jgi:hypothetical protein
VLVQGSREAGILVAGPDAALTLVDVVVRDTASQEGDGKYGRALEAQGGARLDATRVLLEGNRDVAFKAAEAGTVVEIEDLTVRGTLGEASDGAYGRAVQAQDEAQVSIARALLRGNRELSASVFGAGSELRMTDVAIEGTLVTECSIDGRCATDLGGGTGIGAYCEGHAEVTRFHVWDSALCGVQLARGVDVATGRCSTGGTMDLHHGEVAHNAVCGANVQTEGFDVDRLMDDVLFYENGLNLDMAELPVPEGGVPIGE